MDAKWVLVSVSCVGLLLGLVAILLVTSYMACQWGDQHQHRDFRPAHQLICGKTLKFQTKSATGYCSPPGPTAVCCSWCSSHPGEIRGVLS